MSDKMDGVIIGEMAIVAVGVAQDRDSSANLMGVARRISVNLE